MRSIPKPLKRFSFMVQQFETPLSRKRAFTRTLPTGSVRRVEAIMWMAWTCLNTEGWISRSCRTFFKGNIFIVLFPLFHLNWQIGGFLNSGELLVIIDNFTLITESDAHCHRQSVCKYQTLMTLRESGATHWTTCMVNKWKEHSHLLSIFEPPQYTLFAPQFFSAWCRCMLAVRGFRYSVSNSLSHHFNPQPQGLFKTYLFYCL